MSKSQNKIQGYLEDDVKEFFDKFCKDTGRSESNAINLFVKEGRSNRTAAKPSPK